jgi:hypothetical protein
MSSGQKVTFSLLVVVVVVVVVVIVIVIVIIVVILLEVVPSRKSAPFPALLLFSKCILEFAFCDGVRHSLRFSLDHLNLIQIGGKQR